MITVADKRVESGERISLTKSSVVIGGIGMLLRALSIVWEPLEPFNRVWEGIFGAGLLGAQYGQRKATEAATNG